MSSLPVDAHQESHRTNKTTYEPLADDKRMLYVRYVREKSKLNMEDSRGCQISFAHHLPPTSSHSFWLGSENMSQYIVTRGERWSKSSQRMAQVCCFVIEISGADEQCYLVTAAHLITDEFHPEDYLMRKPNDFLHMIQCVIDDIKEEKWYFSHFNGCNHLVQCEPDPIIHIHCGVKRKSISDDNESNIMLFGSDIALLPIERATVGTLVDEKNYESSSVLNIQTKSDLDKLAENYVKVYFSDGKHEGVVVKRKEMDCSSRKWMECYYMFFVSRTHLLKHGDSGTPIYVRDKVSGELILAGLFKGKSHNKCCPKMLQDDEVLSGQFGEEPTFYQAVLMAPNILQIKQEHGKKTLKLVTVYGSVCTTDEPFINQLRRLDCFVAKEIPRMSNFSTPDRRMDPTNLYYAPRNAASGVVAVSQRGFNDVISLTNRHSYIDRRIDIRNISGLIVKEDLKQSFSSAYYGNNYTGEFIMSTGTDTYKWRQIQTYVDNSNGARYSIEGPQTPVRIDISARSLQAPLAPHSPTREQFTFFLITMGFNQLQSVLPVPMDLLSSAIKFAHINGPKVVMVQLLVSALPSDVPTTDEIESALDKVAMPVDSHYCFVFSISDISAAVNEELDKPSCLYLVPWLLGVRNTLKNNSSVLYVSRVRDRQLRSRMKLPFNVSPDPMAIPFSESIACSGDGSALVICMTNSRWDWRDELQDVKYVMGIQLGLNVDLVVDPKRDDVIPFIKTFCKKSNLGMYVVLVVLVYTGGNDHVICGETSVIDVQGVVSAFKLHCRLPKVIITHICQDSNGIVDEQAKKTFLSGCSKKLLPDDNSLCSSVNNDYVLVYSTLADRLCDRGLMFRAFRTHLYDAYYNDKYCNDTVDVVNVLADVRTKVRMKSPVHQHMDVYNLQNRQLSVKLYPNLFQNVVELYQTSYQSALPNVPQDDLASRIKTLSKIYSSPGVLMTVEECLCTRIYLDHLKKDTELLSQEDPMYPDVFCPEVLMDGLPFAQNQSNINPKSYVGDGDVKELFHNRNSSASSDLRPPEAKMPRYIEISRDVSELNLDLADLDGSALDAVLGELSTLKHQLSDRRKEELSRDLIHILKKHRSQGCLKSD